MSKTIEIKKVHIRNLIISLVLGFVILYGLEHFGRFRFIADASSSETYYSNAFESYGSPYTKLKIIYFDTFFDNQFTTSGNGFTIYDMKNIDGEFEKYSVRSYYYTKAMLKDFKQGLFMSFVIFLITIFFTNFKIKIS